MVPHTGNPNIVPTTQPAGTAENIRFRSAGIDHNLRTSDTDANDIP